MAREKSIKIRLTDWEYNCLKAEADRKQIPAAEIIRDLMKRHFEYIETQAS